MGKSEMLYVLEITSFRKKTNDIYLEERKEEVICQLQILQLCRMFVGETNFLCVLPILCGHVPYAQ